MLLKRIKMNKNEINIIFIRKNYYSMNRMMLNYLHYQSLHYQESENDYLYLYSHCILILFI